MTRSNKNNHKVDDIDDKKPSTASWESMNNTGSTQQRMSLIGFRSTFTWVFIALFIIYIFYSFNIILKSNQKECSTPKLDASTEQVHLQTLNNINFQEQKQQQRQRKKREQDATPSLLLGKGHDKRCYDTKIKHIVFGIAASSNLWDKRKEYIKVWWRPNETRGIVWLDKAVRIKKNERLPEIRISEKTSQFKYTHPLGQRAALRISRVVSEILRLGVEEVRWFVMGDDDTVFLVDNVVSVLSKYDHRQFYYIGSSSESHIQNIYLSYAMAYGGGGFAISYPLAKELEKMQDRCIQRYSAMFGSDDRMQACMAELGVPLTKEPGFHQYDVYGDLLGLLGAHPVAPLVSLHHLDVVEPIFPGVSRVKALHHLFESVKQDSVSVMQQSICYDKKRFWSISVSWGYAVQIIRGVMSPRELEMPSRTFVHWNKKVDLGAYTFNTRPLPTNPCQKPFIYYMNSVQYDEPKRQVFGLYIRKNNNNPHCQWKMESPAKIKKIIILKRPDPLRWQKAPRRDCCRVLPSHKKSSMYVWVGNCREGEISEL